MATFKIDAVMNVWFNGLEIKAINKEDALNELYKMSVKDVLSSCCIVSADFEDENVEQIEADYLVEVSGIDYCVEEEDVCDIVSDEHPEIKEGSEEFEELVTKEIEKIKDDLPQTLVLQLDWVRPEDLEDTISDAITFKTNWLINGFKTYKILEMK